MNFSEPSSSSGVKAADLVGHLVIVEPLSHEQDIPTAYGDKDAIKVNVVDLDDANTEHDGVLFFQGLLIAAFKNKIGQTLLGRIEQGQAKPGQSAPFVFTSATDDTAAVDRGLAFLNARAAGTFTSPEPAATATPSVAELQAQLAALNAKG